MPIYEYRCSSCGFEKDALQKMSDPPLVDCPQCGLPALVKLVSAAGFHLKGSGWYATDFKNSGTKPGKSGSGAKPEAKSEGSKESAGEAKGETKADTKPETKSEAAAA